MTEKNREQDEVFSTVEEPKLLSDDEARELLRTAIPMPTPELTEEELEELRQLKPERIDELKPESKDELNIELLGTPSSADVTVSPYKYGGQLVFTNLNGQNMICSAQFVGEENILLTAAHCVRDHTSGQFFQNFNFFRAYNNGNFAQAFAVNAWGTKAGWVDATNTRYQYDYAFLRTTINSDVGYMGYKIFQNESQWTEFGYPRNFGNNQVMQRVDGTRGGISGVVEMLGNPMRSGNSGGAWFIEGSSNNNKAMGNQSYNIVGNATDAWGPVFTPSTFDLLNAVRDRG
jgi:hypothetical protein